MDLKKEGINIEYKTSNKCLPKDFWESYSAFANTKGGKIYLGISEPLRGSYEIVGLQDAHKIETDLWNLLSDKNKVSHNLLSSDDVVIKTINDKDIIIVSVPEAQYDQKPVYINNRKDCCYIRTNDGDRKATEEQFKYMVVNSQNDIDSEILNGYDLDDLNMKDVHLYKNEIAEKIGDESILEKSDKDFLISLGALKKDRLDSSKPYKLTVGGLLFFGKYNSIRDRFPKFQLDYFRKRSSLDTDWLDRISVGDMSYPDLNIFSFYKLTFGKLLAGIKERFELNEDFTRSSFQLDLSTAIREALINSLMHAYYDSDQPIKITEYDDYYEFFNPGNMRITKSEFIHGGTSIIRNSTISVLFRRAGYAEKAGSGGPRIFDTITKHKLKLPEIISSDSSTTLRIWKTDILGSLKNHDLTEKDQKLLEFLIKNHRISKSTAMKSLEFTEYQFKITINNLLEKNIIRKIGVGRSTEYILDHSNEMAIYSNKKLIKMLEDTMLFPDN
ncbi:RNA-binding domain-containing protein [Enterococcus sp. UD-01]|jgi:ATP-dependent DNA helicase RecG|uniref:RNA-binding domain-containing protein n=1 Tax=Enterococcus sp. UD-01 TaxID=3373911 RepID=UPI003837018B